MFITPSCSLHDPLWHVRIQFPTTSEKSRTSALRLPTNEGYNIVSYIVGSHWAERADQLLSWKALRVPSCARLPHQSLSDGLTSEGIRYINGIIAEVPECDVFHRKDGRLFEIASSYLFRLLYQNETDENLRMEC
jgi:hypothetical protein